MFIGRRPGTAPVRMRETPERRDDGRQRLDRLLAYGLLAVELLMCLSLFGPQPLFWFWAGSQVQHVTGFVTAGIGTIMLGTLATLLITVAGAKRVDHAWKLVRRAGGHKQETGALERIFAISVALAVIGFGFWFFIIQGPGPSVAPQN